MTFYVIGTDGSKYGPTDIPTLQQWVAEGRVVSQTLLEEVETGRQGYASSVPSLSFAPNWTVAPSSGPAIYTNSPPPPIPSTYMPMNQMTQNVQPLYGQHNSNAMPMSMPGVMGFSFSYNTSGTKGAIPPEIASLKWNWGAFGLNWLWAMSMKNWKLAILCFLPFFSIGMPFYLGFNGHKIAWQSRRFDSIDHFFTVQRVWTKWGLCYVITITMLAIADVILSPSANASTILPLGLVSVLDYAVFR